MLSCVILGNTQLFDVECSLRNTEFELVFLLSVIEGSLWYGFELWQLTFYFWYTRYFLASVCFNLLLL